jgi:Ca-activated chloride channel homolog
MDLAAEARRMTLLQPNNLMWMVLVGGALAAVVLGRMIGRDALARFFGASSTRVAQALARTRLLRLIGSLLGIIAAALSIVASARPADDPRPRPVQHLTRDLVFAIDVSRSMLAGDLSPNRLARAKLAVSDALELARGDRIGIVAFAGSAVPISPLTNDYTFARMRLDELSPDSVARGGSALGEGIRAAAQMLFSEVDAGSSTQDQRSRTIVLVTDGEDLESDPASAAADLAKRGVRLVTVGLGSDAQGALIPSVSARSGPTVDAFGRVRFGEQPETRSGFVEYQGKRVETLMRPGVLESLARATPGGVFVNVGKGNLDMESIYRGLTSDAAEATTETSELLQYRELFQVLIASALVVLAIQGVLYVRAL